MNFCSIFWQILTNLWSKLRVSWGKKFVKILNEVSVSNSMFSFAFKFLNAWCQSNFETAILMLLISTFS